MKAVKQKRGDAVKEALALLLQKNVRGLTIVELAQLANTSTITASKYIAELKGEGRIDIRPVGSAKLLYWRENNG